MTPLAALKTGEASGVIPLASFVPLVSFGVSSETSGIVDSRDASGMIPDHYRKLVRQAHET